MAQFLRGAMKRKVIFSHRVACGRTRCIRNGFIRCQNGGDCEFSAQGERLNIVGVSVLRSSACSFSRRWTDRYPCGHMRRPEENLCSGGASALVGGVYRR